MPTQVIDTPTQLSTPYSQPFQLRNSGANPVYLGKDTSVSPATRDWLLGPGDVLNFGAETNLYIVTDPGLTSTLDQQYGATNGFTPAPSAVTTYAAALPVKLGTLPATIAAASGSTSQVISDAIDVSAYSSVVLSLTQIANAIVAMDPSGRNYAALVVTQYDDVAMTQQVSYDKCEFLLTTYAANVKFTPCTFQVPVKARYFKVSLAVRVGATMAAPITFGLNVYGSSNPVEHADYFNSHYDPGTNRDLGGSGFAAFLTSVSASAFVSSRNKLAKTVVSKSNGNSTYTGANITVFVSGTAYSIVYADASAVTTKFGNVQNSELILPQFPIAIQADLGGTPGSTVISMTQ